MRRALQTAIITTAATMFPATTQLVEFPIVFTTPFSTEGMVQATDRAQLKRPDLVMHTMGKAEQQQLQYVQQMDELIEDLTKDPDDLAWNITQILDHRIWKQNGKRRVLVKIEWPNDSNTWECLEAVRLQQPETLVVYALSHNLGNHVDWTWTQQYAKHSEHKAKLTMALKVAVERGKKYKFGIEVPRSVTHALFLDRVNGNWLWQDAIENELCQIDDYKTFRKL